MQDKKSLLASGKDANAKTGCSSVRYIIKFNLIT